MENVITLRVDVPDHAVRGGRTMVSTPTFAKTTTKDEFREELQAKLDEVADSALKMFDSLQD